MYHDYITFPYLTVLECIEVPICFGTRVGESASFIFWDHELLIVLSRYKQ